MKHCTTKLGIVLFAIVTAGLATATTPRYTIAGTEDEATVTDGATGLEWQQAATAGAVGWAGALAYCEELEYAGYTDWRLPGVKELMTLVDEVKVAPPAINTVYFVEFFGAGYWTSTTHRTNDITAYVIYFNEQNTTVGRGGVSGVPKTSNSQVLCVRNAN